MALHQAVAESSRESHVLSRIWPAVKEKTGLTQQDVFDRYREICRELGIPPVKQLGTIGHWCRGEYQPDLEHGLVILTVFNEALEEANEEVVDPFDQPGGSPGNRTLNLRIGQPLHLKSV